MGPALHYVAAGLFMIAAASFTGQVRGARGDEAVLPVIGAAASALLVLVMITWGIIASMRERMKGRE